MAFSFRKMLGRPQHLMTIQRAFGQVEQVSINLYFKDASEVDDLLRKADVGLRRKAAEFQREIEAVEAKVRATAEKSKKENR